jgi:hypothetical protein
MLHKQAEYACVGHRKHALNEGGTVMPTEIQGSVLKDIEVIDISKSTKKTFFCSYNMDIDFEKVLFQQD